MTSSSKVMQNNACNRRRC